MSFRLKVAVSSSKIVATLGATLALTGAGGCEPQNPGGGTVSVASAATAIADKVDILFMVDDSSSMTSMQQKMLAQIPTFIQALQALPGGLPDLRLAVVSSDMGAPSDQGLGISCSQTGGDNGNFFNAPEGTCTATTLEAGATWIQDNAAGTTKNFTLADPAGLAAVFECIALLGSNGCGFEHQLASVARALGADGQGPPPEQNQGFLRDDAELAIVFLTNEDDCSAPASGSPLPVYSLNGDNVNDINTPDGPIANYRCNGGPLGGHLCDDPTGAHTTTLAQPPLNPPADATGNPPTLALSNCESNDTASSALTPVSSLISSIKALKADPGNDIVVGAVMAPATPYVVEWLPGAGVSSNQLWPQVEHSCGPASDGSFGDPPVRIAQFVQAFGDNGVTGSICDNSYAAAFALIASKIAAHLPGASTGTGGSGGSSDGGGLGGSTGVTGSGGVPGSGNAGTTGSGSAGASGSGSAGTTGTGSAGASGTGSGGTHGSAGAGGHAGASADGGEADAGEGLGKGSGCGCETGGGSTSPWSLALLAAMPFVRRARRRN